ncbi:hypothetical protein NPIL_666561, partial [Nephila pilipes]
RTENFRSVRRYFETHPNKDLERRTYRRCFNCHSANHLSYNCPEVKKESEQVRPLSSEVQTCFFVPQKGLPLRDITLGDKTISTFIDTGSSVSFICEDVSTMIVDQQKFSNKYNFLSGIGTDIWGQASLKFTEESVEFHKYEGKNCQDHKESICPETKGSIQEIKPENQRTYKKKRRKAPQYEIVI